MTISFTPKVHKHGCCPLCLSFTLEPYFNDKFRPYYSCPHCTLVSVPSSAYLTSKKEKAEYDKHDNGYADDGYRRFLNRTWQPLLDHLKTMNNFSELKGLDFGCGEGAVLSKMALDAGIKIDNYDLYYHYHPELLNKRYDFIILTEVIEHIADAKALVQQLKKMLNPKGIIAIMTKRLIDREAFSRWHYKNDLTHINFYSDNTFQWIAEQNSWSLKFVDKDVVFLIASN